MKETLGYRLKRERVMRGYTQAELADMLNAKNNMFTTIPAKNINKGMISKWENDKDLPSLSNLRQLSWFFDRSMDYFAITDDNENKDVGLALQRARENYKYSIHQVAEDVGIYDDDLARYEDGDPLSSEILENLLNVIHSNSDLYDFLLFYVYPKQYTPYEFDSFITQKDKYDALSESNAQKAIINTTRPIRSVRKIPLLGTIAAGAPILADEHVDEYIEISLDVKADFALRVQGDSMIDANIYDGDIVFIHQQPSVENGEIAAVMLIDPDTSDGIATLKRVYKTANSLQLVPENRNYAPIIVNEENGAGAKILGKATYHITQVR